MTSQLKVDRISPAADSEINVTDPLVTNSIMPTFIKKRTATNNPSGNSGIKDDNGGLNLLQRSLILYGGKAGSEGDGFNTIQVVQDSGGISTRMGCDTNGQGFIDHANGELFLGTSTSNPLYIMTNGATRQTYSADGTILRVVDGQAREMLDAQDMVDLLKGIKDAVNSQTTVEGMRSSIESISDTLISKYEDKVKDFVEPEHPEGHGENL